MQYNITKDILSAVKEWLTQKRQEMTKELKKDCPCDYCKTVKKLAKPIDELLDSLDSPTGEELQEE